MRVCGSVCVWGGGGGGGGFSECGSMIQWVWGLYVKCVGCGSTGLGGGSSSVDLGNVGG